MSRRRISLKATGPTYRSNCRNSVAFHNLTKVSDRGFRTNSEVLIMEQYAVIEFNDGVQMISSSWITEDKKHAYWPTFSNNEKFRKAVKKCVSKMDDWPQHEIKKFWTTTSRYI
ncbi:uncharacterized protein LOC120358006 isoform X2 [Solenopsis invicta]|uniref:uncharacterized protein LOC120358006 isoform X2 n=1 Tax=Solenopsis invicta TaxID=13686 RepID=UPI00193DC243|nr:uncharacterized protein LOC120358006 isoform X2 [Solenopsis invicta]